MKLLIITQKVGKNFPILGFFTKWIKEFSRQCEAVTVICLEKTENDFDKNVKVLSLGKEFGVSRIKYIFNFYKYIWNERGNYDAIFVHMNPIYIVLGGIFWKFWNKKISLWYVHKQIDLKLRIAEKFSDIIFTAAKESFNIKSKKVHIIGHGIDMDEFFPRTDKKSDIFEILSVGRLTPIKNCEILIDAGKILKEKGRQFKIVFVGTPIMKSDHEYIENLKKKIIDYGIEQSVFFDGSVPNVEVYKYYAKAHLSVNLAPTGGLDKAVIESMAMGVPVILSNRALTRYLSPYEKELVFEYNNTNDLVEKIENLFSETKRVEISDFVRKVARENFDLKVLVKKIIKTINE